MKYDKLWDFLFLEISLKAKYTGFSRASSLGNDSLFFVYLQKNLKIMIN